MRDNDTSLIDKAKCLIGYLLCKINLHQYLRSPIIANLDTYWMQGGEWCTRCHKKRISFDDASVLIELAYSRGKERSRTELLVYGNGVKEVVKLYGKEYTYNLINQENQDHD